MSFATQKLTRSLSHDDYSESHPRTPHTPDEAQQEQDEINIESLSKQIATAMNMTHSPSSLSMGRASILPISSLSESTATMASNRARSASNPPVKQRLSNRFFSRGSIISWSNRPLSESQSTRTSTSSSSSRAGSPRTSESARRQSSARLTWLTGDVSKEQANADSSERAQAPPGEGPFADDGLDELLYRGIRVKEIKTTLKTMVIPHEVHHPMPKVTLERPGFARINY